MELIKEIRPFDFSIYNIDNIEEQEILKKNGYFECVFTNTKPEENDIYNVSYKLIFNKEEQIYEKTWVKEKNVLLIKNKILSIKQQLSDTDYKVIKNMEAQLVNEELPYDSVTLHTERQALRDKINELEELLKQ